MFMQQIEKRTLRAALMVPALLTANGARSRLPVAGPWKT
jgi:hypothetical protein